MMLQRNISMQSSKEQFLYVNNSPAPTTQSNSRPVRCNEMLHFSAPFERNCVNIERDRGRDMMLVLFPSNQFQFIYFGVYITCIAIGEQTRCLFSYARIAFASHSRELKIRLKNWFQIERGANMSKCRLEMSKALETEIRSALIGVAQLALSNYLILG